jgi:MFS transporter, putative metabolite:H+ symporter
MSTEVKESSPWSEVLSGAVVVSALGYFVDIYDLILFSIVRVKSLGDLGLVGPDVLDKGLLLLNLQMVGMLLGGLVWGVLGDRLGRVRVLFGSIVLYSVANLLNAFVTNVDQYAVLRFIAGVGLAGELGAAITLVSESLSTRGRGHGATIVAAVGVSGAILAGVIGAAVGWRVAYFIGGVLGLLLLFLRVRTFESNMFKRTVLQTGLARGDFLMILRSKERLVRYTKAIMIGVPLWFGVGILVTLSPEIARSLNVTGEVNAAQAVMLSYSGIALGDLASGLLSQRLRSRKTAALVFMVFSLLCAAAFTLAQGSSPSVIYAICFLMGFGMGYWAVFMMISSELFGTNLRATVTTSVPNFVRGSVVPMTLLFTFLKADFGIVGAAQIVGVLAFAGAFWAVLTIKETYGTDLEFVESLP